jgi:hypothetical protein
MARCPECRRIAQESDLTLILGNGADTESQDLCIELLYTTLPAPSCHASRAQERALVIEITLVERRIQELFSQLVET